jgi:tripartite-type tricarboxylate transporter receptor subunit TctC
LNPRNPRLGYAALRLLRGALGALAIAAMPLTSALAQGYPNKPIKLVVAWPAGGTTDAAARIVAQRLGERLFTPVIIENKGGANGRIGAEYAAKSAPDGYTLFFTSAETHAINQHLYQRMAYDPVRDFVGVAPVAINSFAITARPDFPAKSVKEIVAMAKASPGKLTFASWGIGSTSHIGMETFKVASGSDMLHVAFQGEAPAVTALMGGQVDLMMLSAARAESLRKDGKVKVYANTMATRFFAMPEIPSLKEEGFSDITVANWFGVVAPAQSPDAIVNKLSTEIAALMKSPEVLAQFRALGLDASPAMSPADFEKFIKSESLSWGGVIKRANVRLD